jgi:hypothetical protein
MGFRFRKRIKLLPWVYLNLSKSGASISISKSIFTLNLSKSKGEFTINLPIVGFFWKNRFSTNDAGSNKHRTRLDLNTDKKRISHDKEKE